MVAKCIGVGCGAVVAVEEVVAADSGCVNPAVVGVDVAFVKAETLVTASSAVLVEADLVNAANSADASFVKSAVAEVGQEDGKDSVL